MQVCPCHSSPCTYIHAHILQSYLYILWSTVVHKRVVEGEVGERSLESCKELVELDGVGKKDDSTQLLIETAMKVQQL